MYVYKKESKAETGNSNWPEGGKLGSTSRLITIFWPHHTSSLFICWTQCACVCVSNPSHLTHSLSGPYNLFHFYQTSRHIDFCLTWEPKNIASQRTIISWSLLSIRSGKKKKNGWIGLLMRVICLCLLNVIKVDWLRELIIRLGWWHAGELSFCSNPKTQSR